MDELLTEEEVLHILDQHRSTIQSDDGLVGFAKAVQKACIAKRWRNTFRRLVTGTPPSGWQRGPDWPEKKTDET